jgi:hypothetical protein
MFSRTDLIHLIEAKPAVGVSIFLSAHKFGRETRQNPTSLKNLLTEAQGKLEQKGMTVTETEALLAPAADLLEDYDFWQHQEHGLALFLSEAGMEVHKLPIGLADAVVVGPGFHIVPLVGLLEHDAAFVVLTVTAEATRADLATRFGMTKIDVSGMPDSIESLDGEPDYEGSLQSHGYGRPHTGGHNMPKTQVYGDSPEEWRKGRLIEYARRTAAALAAHMAHAPLAVVVVSDAEISGHIAKSEALAPLIAGNVEVNPAILGEAELHAAAWAVMQPIRDEAQDAALNRLEAQSERGDATACSDPAQLVAAAHHGRVEILFLAADAAALHGTFDAETGAVTVTQEETSATVDLLDLAARLSLRSGGEVRVVAQDRLPDGVSMAAILRY